MLYSLNIWLEDIFKIKVRFSQERKNHIENSHPEMPGEMKKIQETLQNPDIVVKSKVDINVELFYKNYKNTSLEKNIYAL